MKNLQVLGCELNFLMIQECYIEIKCIIGSERRDIYYSINATAASYIMKFFMFVSGFNYLLATAKLRGEVTNRKLQISLSSFSHWLT